MVKKNIFSKKFKEKLLQEQLKRGLGKQLNYISRQFI